MQENVDKVVIFVDGCAVEELALEGCFSIVIQKWFWFW